MSNLYDTHRCESIRHKVLKNLFKKFLSLLLILLFVSVTIQVQAQITGTVFRDFNADGTQTASNPIEPGLTGYTVTAYNTAGTSLAALTITATTGTYSFTSAQIAGGTAVRLEFTLPSGAYATNGSTSNTTVQFVTAGAGVTANLGVNFPEDYWNNTTQAIPNLMLPCYSNGTVTAAANIEPGIVEFANNANGLAIAKTAVATMGQVGTIWGNAYQRSKDRFFYCR